MRRPRSAPQIPAFGTSGQLRSQGYNSRLKGGRVHPTKLRKVGGSVVLALPPALLDVLNLRAGARVNIGIEGGRLVVAPRTRPYYSLDELLAQCEKTPGRPNDGDRAWLDAEPVGNELL